MSQDEDAAAAFEPHRRYLRGIAYRMLGSVAEAEDAVQDAFLRWHDADRAAVVEPRAFLTRIVTRLCLVAGPGPARLAAEVGPRVDAEHLAEAAVVVDP